MVNWKMVLVCILGMLIGLYLGTVDKPTLEECEPVCVEIHC